jgi:hypothetical protein
VFTSCTVGNCGADTDLGGYSIVVADDLDAAMALIKGCPAVGDGGGVEVGEVTNTRTQPPPGHRRAPESESTSGAPATKTTPYGGSANQR